MWHFCIQPAREVCSSQLRTTPRCCLSHTSWSTPGVYDWKSLHVALCGGTIEFVSLFVQVGFPLEFLLPTV